MRQELNQLLECIADDFATWISRTDYCRGDDRLAQFKAELSFSEGKKYIKILNDKSVWGFIVKADDGKFKAGDILKAASWAAPARNTARGNILEGNFNWVQWTGPAYL